MLRADARQHAVTRMHQSTQFLDIPDVPSAAEVGLPAYDVHTWYGLWALKGTLPEVQAAAIEAFRKAAQDPEAKTVWAGQGADFPNVTGAQFGKLIHDEIRKWADVVKASGAKLE